MLFILYHLKERGFMKRLIFLLLLVSFAVFAPAAWATNGAQLIGYSAIHEGLGGGGTAFAQDVSTIMMNPAALTELPTMVNFNLFLGYPYTRTDVSGVPVDPSIGISPANTGAGTQTSNEDGIFLPGAGIVLKTPWLDNRITVGFSLCAVAGFGTDYNQSRLNPQILPSGGTYDTGAFYGVLKLLPAVAYKINDQWSVGLTLHVDRTQLETDSATGAASAFAETAGRSRVDFGWGVGVGMGLLYKPTSLFSVGLNYISEQYIADYERYKDILPQGLNFPQQLNLGIAVNPLDSVTLIADFKWINWSGADGGFGTPVSEGGFGWQDQYVAIVGAQWEATDMITLRTGYNYGRSSVPSDSIFTSLLATTIAEHHFCLGLGLQLTDRLRLDASYVRIPTNTMRDSNGAWAKQSMHHGNVEIGFRF
jgi:long-chain fatty acid transport protein